MKSPPFSSQIPPSGFQLSFLDVGVASGILLLACWSPLPFGSVEGWARGILHFCAFLLLAVWSVRLVLDRQPIRVRLNPGVYFLGAVLVVVGIQLLPFAPASIRSIDPFLTYLGFLHLLSLGVIYFLVINTVTTRERLRLAVSALALWGGVIALYAVIQHFMGQGQYAALRKLSVAAPFGTFVNRNHFAGFAEMIAPIALALATFRRSKGDDTRIFFAIAGILIFLALILSGSRGGWLAAVILVVCFASLATREWKQSPQITAGGLLLIPVMVGMGVWWMGVEPLAARLNANDQDTAQLKEIGRFAIWKNTMSLVRERPVLGTGLGTYEIAYPRWDRSDGRFRVEQAHNDYLQSLAELGVVGGAIVLGFLGWLFYRMWKGFHDRTTPSQVRWIRIGCLSGCVGLLVHSFVDFNLQIPSNALYFVLLVGFATTEIDSAHEE